MDDWWFGADGDIIQELGDFVHFLMINPSTSPMTAEDIEMAKECARKEALDFERENEYEPKEGSAAEDVDKKKGDDDDDETPILPPVPDKRLRGKGLEKRKADHENPEEAWTVKWAPLTKNGVLDFVSNCSGRSCKPKTIDNSLSTQPPTVSPAKTIHNLKDSINGSQLSLGKPFMYWIASSARSPRI